MRIRAEAPPATGAASGPLRETREDARPEAHAPSRVERLEMVISHLRVARKAVELDPGLAARELERCRDEILRLLALDASAGLPRTTGVERILRDVEDLIDHLALIPAGASA